MDFYDLLAAEVIKRAAKDYVIALCGTTERGYSPRLPELESFFHSWWFGVLTKLDPDRLIADLKNLAQSYKYDWREIQKHAFLKINKKGDRESYEDYD